MTEGTAGVPGTRGIAVVGASLGGLRAAEQLRAAGWSGRITVYGDERQRPYNRPPLSKEVLAGTAAPESTTLRHRPSVEDVEWRLGTRVRSADLAARTLELEDGTRVPYEGLVAATGLRPRRLELVGSGPSRHVVRTLDDAAGLRAALAPGVRVAVVGTGFIGCEVAATARGLGCEVTVIAPEEQPMLRPLGAVLAGVLRRRHEAEGVRFALGRLPSRLTADGVELDDGTSVRADVLVEAVGSLPNTEWLAGNGLDLSDGVLCDGGLRMGGHAHAVAVGDVARFPNARYGADPHGGPGEDTVPARRVEHWSIPGDSAKHAARVLVAGLTGAPLPEAPFAPLPSFWSDQYDLRLQSFGAPQLADETALLEGSPDADPVMGYYRAGRLIAVVALGGPMVTMAAMEYRPQLMELPQTEGAVVAG